LEIKRKGESRERIEVRTSADYVYFGVSRFFFMFYGWKISFGGKCKFEFDMTPPLFLFQDLTNKLPLYLKTEKKVETLFS
jgi:hypothetical protein